MKDKGASAPGLGEFEIRDLAVKYCAYETDGRCYNILRYEIDEDFFNFCRALISLGLTRASAATVGEASGVRHPISGQTLEELWLETGKLRSQIADMKAAQQQAEPGADEREEFEREARRWGMDLSAHNGVYTASETHRSWYMWRRAYIAAQSGQRAGVAESRESGLVDALMAACETLPAGYNIALDVENGWAGVRLAGPQPDGGGMDYSDGESSLTEQVLAATKDALAAAPTQQQEDE